MDIQRQAFEEAFKNNNAYNIELIHGTNTPTFEQNSKGEYLKISVQNHWEMWQQAQKSAVPQKTETVYLVWNEAHNECVGFTDKRDAKYASTGIQTSVSYSTLAGEFREIYEYQMDGSNFNITEIQIEAQEQVG